MTGRGKFILCALLAWAILSAGLMVVWRTTPPDSTARHFGIVVWSLIWFAVNLPTSAWATKRYLPRCGATTASRALRCTMARDHLGPHSAPAPWGTRIWDNERDAT